MIHEPTFLSVIVFAVFVAATLALSFYFAAKTKSAAGYFVFEFKQALKLH